MTENMKMDNLWKAFSLNFHSPPSLWDLLTNINEKYVQYNGLVKVTHASTYSVIDND